MLGFVCRDLGSRCDTKIGRNYIRQSGVAQPDELAVGSNRCNDGKRNRAGRYFLMPVHDWYLAAEADINPTAHGIGGSDTRRGF